MQNTKSGMVDVMPDSEMCIPRTTVTERQARADGGM